MENESFNLVLAEISKDLKRIVSLLEDARHERPVEKKWIDRLEVEKLLESSESTIKRYNRDGILEPIRIGRKNWYKRSEIFKNRDKFLKIPSKGKHIRRDLVGP